MEVDCPAYALKDQQQQQHHHLAVATPLCQALAVQHTHACSHTCAVQHEFGNVFRCTTSGLLHVCDSTCRSRIWRDHHSSICVISRKVCEPLPYHHMPQRAKRACQDDKQEAFRKRFNTCGSFGCVPIA